MNCGSELALAHNDQAVLENHHSFVTFELLRDPELNVLTPTEEVAVDSPPSASGSSSAPGSAGGDTAATTEANSSTDSPSTPDSAGGNASSGHGASSSAAAGTWTASQFRNFRRTVISAILSTDMLKHFDLCKKLDSMEPDLLSLDPAKEEDRQFLIDLLTHSADLSGQVLPYEMAVQWEERLTQEFTWQASMEANLGPPVTTFMQGLADPTVRYKNHVNYLGQK